MLFARNITEKCWKGNRQAIHRNEFTKLDELTTTFEGENENCYTSGQSRFRIDVIDDESYS